MTTSSLPILLQVADSAFPTGAFAYSNGLEALARAGRFPDAVALETYLETCLRQAEGFDLAFIVAAHESGEENSFAELCLTWDAFYWNQNIRKASLRQGRACLNLLCELFPNPGLEALKTNADANQWTLHFALALGRSLSLMGISRMETCWVYLHGLVRDQVAAVVRLGLLGPRTAQSMQAGVLAQSLKRIGEGLNLPTPKNAWRTAPLIEVGQGGHEFLYSRLYQN